MIEIRRITVLFMLIGLLAPVLGCVAVSSPTIGPALQKQSLELAKQLEQSGMLLDDPELTAYVSSVGSRIVAEAESSPVPAFAFAVLDAPEPNAFSIPSGHVYISRGLLVLLENEDELAGILGHEVAHVLEQHSLKQTAGSLTFAPIRLVTAVGGGLVGLALPRVGGAVQATGEVPAALAGASYGRSQENEADRVGQDLAIRAGWDPSGLPRVMDALAAQQRIYGQDPGAISWFATHPPSPDRAARLRERAAAVDRTAGESVAIPRRDFLARLEGLVVGESAAGGVFVGNTFFHPGLGIAVHFPAGEGWIYLNTERAVAAAREQPPAAVILELVAKGDDALAAAKAFEPKAGKLDAPPAPERVNGLETAYATGGVKRRWGKPSIRASARWIAFDGYVYRILSESTDSGYARFAEDFDAAERSLRALALADREQIFERRLRIVEARDGEALSALLDRVGSTWDAAQAAAANGIETSHRFAAGELVKVTRREAYSSEL